MADELIDVEELVGRVKAAIRSAELSTTPNPTDVVVTQVDLTLRVVRDLEAGVEARWKVPWIGLDLGAHRSRKWSSTNTIELSLVPPPPRKLLGKGEPPMLDLDADLRDAIGMVRATVAAAAVGEPVFELKGSSVEMGFGVTDTGGLSLIAKAEASRDTTQTLKLKLGGPGQTT